MSVSQLNAREIDLTKPDHVKRIILEIDNEQNRRRKRKAWILNQCKEGNQRQYVKDQLAVTYPKTHNKFRIGDINISGKIDNKLNKAYKSSPIRQCENEKETEFINDTYAQYKFSRAFKEADSIYNLHKYVCLWLTWQDPKEEIGIDEGSYVLHALKPYEYDLVRDQVTGEPIIFIQSVATTEVTRLAGRSDGIEQTISESQSDTAAQSKVYYFWNKDVYVEATVTKAAGHADASEDDIEVNVTKKTKNKLGVLPITYLQADSSVDYPIDSNLAEKSIDWNVAFSDLKTSSSAQGHGQLVITLPEGQKQKDVHMGMHTAITLPQSKKPDAPSTDAKYISASPDLTGQLEVLKFDVSNLLDDYGIKAKGTIEGGAEKFSSGFDRLVSEADVQDTIEDNQSLYSITLEQGNFTVLKAYERAMNQNPLSTTDVLKVAFEKPKVLISDKETLDNIEKREELGLSLDHEKHIIMNPNLTEEQAIEREKKIREQKKAKLKEMSEMVEDEDDQDEDDDINKDKDEE
jgi:hypothetical protein